MRRAPGLAKPEPGKGRVVCGQFDTGLELDRILAACAAKILHRLHQPGSYALPLEHWLDRELADIEIPRPLQRKDAADDAAVLDGHKPRLPFRFLAKAVGAQQMRRGWRVDDAVHIGEGAA